MSGLRPESFLNDRFSETCVGKFGALRGSGYASGVGLRLESFLNESRKLARVMQRKRNLVSICGDDSGAKDRAPATVLIRLAWMLANAL